MDIISTRSDPFNILPIELVLQIFHYLPLLDAWRYQHVCKRWRAVLSSHEVLNDALWRWENIGHAGTARQGGLIAARLRRMRAVRLGRPFSVAVHQDTRVRGSRGDTILHDDSLTFIEESETFVVVRNLVSGKISRYCSEGRERIIQVAVTSSHMAYLSLQGILSVRRHDSPEAEATSVRLPSAHVFAMCGDRALFALLSAPISKETTVYIYNSDTGYLRAHKLCYVGVPAHLGAGVLMPRGLLIDEKSRTVDLFGCTKFGVLAVNTRYTLTGADNVDDDALIQPSAQSTIKVSPRCRMIHFVPTGYQDIFRVQQTLVSASYVEEAYDPASVSVLFNQRTAELYEEHHPVIESPSHPRAQIRDIIRYKDIIFNHDSFCSFTTYSSAYGLTRARSHLTTLDPRIVAEVDSTHPSDHVRWHPDLNYTALMNGDFLVGVQFALQESGIRSHIVVFCFNEDIAMSNGYKTGLWEAEDGTGRPSEDVPLIRVEDLYGRVSS